MPLYGWQKPFSRDLKGKTNYARVQIKLVIQWAATLCPSSIAYIHLYNQYNPLMLHAEVFLIMFPLSQMDR